jgi:hypothetical protein
MSSKLNLEVGRGNGFNEQNRFAVKFDIKNHDTSAVALSGLRVVAYSWLQYRNILSQFTSGINSQGMLSQFTSAFDPMNGVGQTGIVNLNVTDKTYRVYHNVVDSSKVAPQLTLNAPNGSNSYATVVSYNNSTDTYFDIVINETMPTPGYTVTWFIPGTYDAYTGSTTNVGSPNLTIEKVPEYIRVKNRKYDSRFIFSWTGNSNLINPNWGLKDTDVYVQFNPTLYQASNITSAWYSSITDSVLEDNPYFVLEQWNGSSWQIVQEYISSGTLDNLTGTLLTDLNFVKIINNGSGNNVSTYISVSDTNPVSANASDKNNLSLWSKSSTDKRRRSLIKFDTSAIPSSATGIKNAILRLNVNSLTNAWNHFSTNGHVAVHRITTDWIENQATWTNRKTGIPWTTSGGDYDTTPAIWVGNSELSNSFTSADQNKQFWMDFDVTSIVDYWRLNPSQNYGLLIKLYDYANENNSTDIKWELNSGRLAGTGAISGFPQLLVSYNSLNVSGAIPTVEFKYPNDNSIIFNSTFSLSANTSITTGQVESVNAYYRPTYSVLPYQLFGSLGNNGINSWNSVFTSLSAGSYDFILRAVSDLGDFGNSDSIRINFENTPAITYRTDTTCNVGTVDLFGTIDISNATPIAGSVSYLKSYIPTNKKITSIIEDRISSGVVWVATDGNGLYRVDLNSVENRVISFNTTNSSISYDYINDISMDSQGVLWISYLGNGIGLFDTRNWEVRNSSDWYLYNSSNSSLSAYPANAIDICDINIDANDNKWFSLTYQSTYSLLKLSGYSFTDTNTIKYNIGAIPRKSVSRGSYTYVATDDNRLFKFDGITWNNYTLPTFKTINDIGIDTFDTVWLATDSGFASFVGTTFTELQPSATNSWPDGLNSGKGQLTNKQAKSVFIDGQNYKWFSYSTGLDSEYNGGVVKYNWNVIDGTGIASHISIFDRKNYSGILSNNVLKTIYTSSTDRMWVATDVGLCVLNGNVWETVSKDTEVFPMVLSGGNWNATLVEPMYGNVSYILDFEYSNGEHFTSSINISSTKLPSILINYPSAQFATVQSEQVSKILDYNIDCVDVETGASVSVEIQKAPTSDGPWYPILGFTNALNYPIYDYVYPEDFYYLKVVATNGICVAESTPRAFYGAVQSITTVDPIVGNVFSNTPVNFYGSVYSSDFSRIIDVDGTSYVDSLESVEFGYTTSAGFQSVGFATLTSVINSSANFYFEWTSPIPGVSSLSAISRTIYGTSSVGSVSFNAVVSTPIITILSPTVNQYIKLNSNFVLSASTSYLSSPVSALNYYISNVAGTSSIGSATSAGINLWTKSISPSAYGSGVFSISATCKDIAGTSSISNSTQFYINTLPTVSQISDLSATHTGTYSFQIKINDQNSFYNNKVEIISAGSVYTSGMSNGFGDFIWNWLNPPNGSISLSAKIYDGNPSTSSDYTIYPFVLNLNKLYGSINSFAYPSGKLDSVTITPKVNVVTTNTTITPTLTTVGSNLSAVNYWLCNYDFSTSSYYKQSILSGSSFRLPSSREYISQTTSRYHFWGILAELVSTNGSSFETELAYFYVKEQSISGDISNSVCENPLLFSGNLLDSDNPYSRNNTIIDTSVSALIYNETSGTYLGTLSLGNRTSEEIPYTYSWTNPLSSVSAVSVRVIDSYGISASQIINYGGLDTQPIITMVSGVSSIANLYGSIYLVSAGSYTVSANTSATKIKDLHFEYLLDDVWYTVSATQNKTATINIPLTSGSFAIHSYVKTSGNCVAQSDEQIFITLAPISANIYPDNCSECYCNGGRLRIVGNVIDPNFKNDYITRVFGRSVSAYLYDNFNNLISNISSQLIDGVGSFETYWETPTVGATSVYVKIVDNNGVDQVISKQLARSIYDSPTLNFISPVDYSISGTIYRQDNSITFSSLVSSTDLLCVKYYVNGELKSTTNSSNGFSYNWNEDKLPGLYSVSAIAINSNGCYSISSKSIMVSNSPVTKFLYPIDSTYYQVGTLLSASVDSKGNSPATVSAVSVKFAGSSFNTSYNSVNKTWETLLSAVSSSASTYTISAYSYDTLGQMNISRIVISASNSPVFSATVSGVSAVSASYNTLLPLTVSGYSTNGGSLVSCYINVSNKIIEIPKVSSNVFYSDLLIPLYFTSGNNSINVYVIDSVGAISSRVVSLFVNAYTGVISYPVIKNLGSSPMNKVIYRN